MKLPNADHATVPPEKISAYLLNVRHQRARGKATFFLSLGFSLSRPGQFSAALLEHARIHPVVSSRPARDGSGTNYALVGILRTPDGRNPLVCTIWFIDVESNSPRLVTAYGA